MLNEVQQAQEQLGQSLARAQIGEDRALAGQVREQGEHLVHLLTGLLRMGRIHASDNRAFDKPVADVRVLIEGLYGLLGAIHIVTVEDQVYLNDIRIRNADRGGGADLGQEIRRHNVGALSLFKPLSEQHIRLLVSALAANPPEKERRNTLVRALRKQGVRDVEFFGTFRFRMAGEADVRKFDPAEYLKRVGDAVQEAFENLAAGRLPNPLTLRRLIAELLGQDLGAEGLWQDPPRAAAHVVHAFRVAHLSLILGQGLELNPGVLQDLGLAALYHDAGYAASEPVATELHASAGARLLMRQRGFHEAKTRRVLAVLQHDRDFNDRRGRPGLFARIIRIAEDYDNLVRRNGLPPAAALAMLTPWAGNRYDPALLQCFINRMGRIPPGTLVELEDGRVVRSISLVRAAESFDKPLARVVRDARGAPLDPAPLIDLAQEGRARRVKARL